MDELLLNIKSELEGLINDIKLTINSDEPFSNAQGQWSFPGINRSELIEEAQILIDFILNYGDQQIEHGEQRLQDYIRRLQFLRQHTVPQLWHQAPQAVSAYLITLQGLGKALNFSLERDLRGENIARLKKVRGQLTSLEAQLNGLAPRADSLTNMVERIEGAYNAADQLPADLESLSEARDKIATIVTGAEKSLNEISVIKNTIRQFNADIELNKNTAAAVLAHCETAYSAATSVGLAAAFIERSDKLSESMWVWVGGLVVSLIVGGCVGSAQLHSLSDLLRMPNASTPLVILNLLLSILSVGAPIWFAWLSTKQIGQRFRLSEDYAFKASISRAYEGFRREAARIDTRMEAKLLSSALNRLDELPLRLVETESHGSPWHELTSSNPVKMAMKSIPGFAEQVKSLAENMMKTGKVSAEQPKLSGQVLKEQNDEN